MMDDDKRVTAAAIVAALLEDLRGRQGLKQEWNAIDSEIQREIIETWRAIAVRNLP